MQITRQIVSDSVANRVSYGRENKRKAITVHQTGNTTRGAGAQAHANLQSRANSRQASWHYQIDDKEIIQSFDHEWSLWHAGDRRGNGNMHTIAIELCINSDSDYLKTLENGAWLVRYLIKKEGLTYHDVYQHFDWSPKNCPAQIRAKMKGISWHDFINIVRDHENEDDFIRVQLGAFAVKQNAKNFLTKVKNDFSDAFMLEVDGIYKVQIGAFTNEDNARRMEQLAKEKGYDVFVDGPEATVPEDLEEESTQPKLVVDGIWGPKTTSELQRQLGTIVVGHISNQRRNRQTLAIPSVRFSDRGSSLVVQELQRKIGARVDGWIGRQTVTLLQRYLGTIQDGFISRPSLMVKELQRRLNGGDF